MIIFSTKNKGGAVRKIWFRAGTWIDTTNHLERVSLATGAFLFLKKNRVATGAHSRRPGLSVSTKGRYW